MGITQQEMTQRSIKSRQAKKEQVANEARKMHKAGFAVKDIAKVLGEKHKKNGKPFHTDTIYDYIGGIREK